MINKKLKKRSFTITLMNKTEETSGARGTMIREIREIASDRKRWEKWLKTH